MLKYTKSQEKLIKNTDYDKDGRSPILQKMNTSLDSIERQVLNPNNSIDEYGEPKRDPLSEEQLKNILRKCKNYELNVQKNKIDMEYIKQLKNSLERYQKLLKIPN